MKLVLCRKCQDIFKLAQTPRSCACGACGGRYLDDLQGEYWGEEAVPIGFANNSLAKAVMNQPKAGMGKVFEAFVIPVACFTMRKIESPKEK